MSSVARMTIVDDLLSPGAVRRHRHRPRRRLPGGAGALVGDCRCPACAGVTLDYEIFNPSTPDRIHGHIEHTMLATHDGGSVMVIGHEHAPVLAILRETEPGVVRARPGGVAVPDEGASYDARTRAAPALVVVRRAGRRGRRTGCLAAQATALILRQPHDSRRRAIVAAAKQSRKMQFRGRGYPAVVQPYACPGPQ